jgi:hypothetical protein
MVDFERRLIGAVESMTDRHCRGIIVGFGVFVAALLLAINALSPADRPIIKVSGADSVAYFATAHSLLFDFDFDLTNENAILRPTHYVGVRPQTGLPGSPWPIGYSLLQVPFLALGTVVDYLARNPTDGYSRYAVTFYYLGNVVLMTIGLIGLFSFLDAFTRRQLPAVSETRRLWTCLAVTLVLWPSTTLGYHTFASLSHVAGFMAVTLMLLVWWHVKDRNRPWEWVLVGVCGGLTILCRWQNALLLLWPFLYDLWGWRSLRLLEIVVQLAVAAGPAALRQRGDRLPHPSVHPMESDLWKVRDQSSGRRLHTDSPSIRSQGSRVHSTRLVHLDPRGRGVRDGVALWMLPSTQGLHSSDHGPVSRSGGAWFVTDRVAHG